MEDRTHLNSAPRLLVVGGTMRGGTTLLRDILHSHPAIQLTELELRALRYADMTTWAHAAAVHQGSIASINRIQSRRFRGQVFRYLRDIFRGHGLRELTTVDRIHRAFVAALADGKQTRYVGDKYPDYVLQYPQFIHRADTRCIFIYRDPRDVVASIVDRIQRGDWQRYKWAARYNTVEKATDYWLTIMQAIFDLQRLDTNVLVLRYESLVTKPAEGIAEIASHLELPAEGFDARLPTDSSIGRYRERLTLPQVSEIETRAATLMQAFRYFP
jgi:hypothetical protein